MTTTTTTPTKQYAVSNTTTPTRHNPSSIFLNARLPPAAERDLAEHGQGRVSPMKRALSPELGNRSISRIETRSDRIPIRSIGQWDEEGLSTKPLGWGIGDPSRSSPIKSSFEGVNRDSEWAPPGHAPRLHDLTGMASLEYPPRDQTSWTTSRRSTMEDEGSIGQHGMMSQGASTDRLVARAGVPMALVSALGLGPEEPGEKSRDSGTSGWDNSARSDRNPMDGLNQSQLHHYPPSMQSNTGSTTAPRLYDLNRASTLGRPFADLTDLGPRARSPLPSQPMPNPVPPSTEPYRRRSSSVRKYKRLQAQPLQSTTYFLQGRLITGGDSILPLIGSFVLVLGMGGLWLGTTGVWVWRDGLGGGGAGKGGKAAVIIFAYLFGICIGSMIATAFRDPGG